MVLPGGALPMLCMLGMLGLFIEHAAQLAIFAQSGLSLGRAGGGTMPTPTSA